MRNVLVFLNELSFDPDPPIAAGQLLPHVLAMINGVRAARKVRQDLTVIGCVQLAGVFLCNGTSSLAEILRGDLHKDEWRFLRTLDQLSPWDSYPGASGPDLAQDVQFGERNAVGMLWAHQNKTAVVSFPFPPEWQKAVLRAYAGKLEEDGEIVPNEIAIPNIATSEHVAVHRRLLEEYGRELSNSSIVFEGGGLVIRMFFNDHNPPHFHVMLQTKPDDTIARYAIRTGDLLSGNLSGALRQTVEEWAALRREDLLANWERCRRGVYPFRVE